MIFYPPFAERTPELVAAYAAIAKLKAKLEEAKDVISYALEMSSDDDSTRVFEDYLEVSA